ncbi:UDP-N-acetylmuramoyl-tripeptide--D-alanyl-D-alanine ligase [Forsythia ovata]|uniref:UDP-MurNAc-pentapeptide synthetase n=1 Tax=Forsythia ovata TaxID=205694 RepID=A0ABD1W838_9LAMI
MPQITITPTYNTSYIFIKPTKRSSSFTNPTRIISQITPFSSSNSPHWTAPEIAEAINGRINKWGPPGTISTDTRDLRPGQWFLPLVGQNYDAHCFITPELSSKGCIGVIGNHVCKDWDMGFVQVDGSTLNSLKQLGHFARKRINGCLIGLTGSVGKTTTRTMIALGLESIGTVYQSHGNWNNEIGVALTLIGMPRNVGFGVLELGMSQKGEMLELARMCRPNVRVILNVGASHLENFASLKEVSMAKGEILRDAMPGDICVLNADDPLVMSLPVPMGVKKVLFGRRKGSDVRLVSAQSIDGGHKVQVVLERSEEVVEFVIPSPGLHLALDACAAAAIATYLGVPLSLFGKSFSKFIPVHGRSELEIAENGIKVVNDTYNASPDSTRSAIDLLRAIECKGRKVAILGDMLELGPKEIMFHELILQHCVDARIDLVALVGKRFSTAAENLNIGQEMKLVCAYDADELASRFSRNLHWDDVVLVKGSRGMQMEKIISFIKSCVLVSHIRTF